MKMPERFIEGMGGFAVFSLVSFVLLSTYACGGCVLARRNEGTWDGPFAHPHSKEWREARIYVGRELGRATAVVVEKARYGNRRDDPSDHVHASPAPKAFRDGGNIGAVRPAGFGGVGQNAYVRERRRSNDSLGHYSRAFAAEIDACGRRDVFRFGDRLINFGHGTSTASGGCRFVDIGRKNWSLLLRRSVDWSNSMEAMSFSFPLYAIAIVL